MSCRCSICGSAIADGEQHIHIGQIHVLSEAWTGRSRYETKPRRVSTALWAKVYVWLRFKVKDALCRAAGGHYWDWWHDQCELCFMRGDEREDFRGISLLKALRFHMVVL